MPDSDRVRRLVEWSLATFHASVFFVVLVALLYANGSLGNLLASLNTLVGLALFGLFWLTTWWTTRRALRGLEWMALRGWSAALTAARRALRWGAINGLLFFWIIFVFAATVLFVSLLVQGDLTGPFFLILLAASLIGSAVALALGAAVGLLLAIIDSALFSLAHSLWPPSAAPGTDSSP